MPETFTPIPKPSRITDAECEARIRNEIIVDTYGDDEVCSAWYDYLQDNLEFPFQAYVHVENPTPAEMHILATVMGMAESDSAQFIQFGLSHM